MKLNMAKNDIVNNNTKKTRIKNNFLAFFWLL